MGLFTGVGDFFRGVFGEDEEEKKRRKQREAQQAAARRQQAQSRPQNNPVNQPKVTNVNQLFGNKNNPADPLGITGVQAPKPLFQQMQEQSKAPAPKPAPQPKAPLPDQQFTGISEGEGKNKTIFGWNAAALLPKDYEKKYEVKADRTVVTNKDKYVAQFDRLHPDYQKVLVNAAKEKAKNGDQAAINTLQALKDTGRLEGNVMDFIEGSNERFLGGVGRGLLRTTDFVLPGKNTFGLEQLADEQDASKNGTRQFTDAGRAGETTGTVQKGIFDVASMVIPGSALDKTMKGAKLVQTLENGTKIMRVGGTLVRVIPGSLMGTGIDYVQSIGRGDRPDLAESAATGLGVDLALEALPGASKYGAKGIRKLFGKEAGNFVEGIIKETDPTAIKNMLGIEGDVADEVISKLATETNPEVVRETLKELALDPNLQLSGDVVQRLQDEGIVAVKQDQNAPYEATYKDGEITARNQAALDANVNHELGHHVWQNKLTPEEKALFKGDGAASREAAGRAGYTADDVISEDFSDYMNKALRGQLSEVPEELRGVIAKYAKVALTDADAIAVTVKQTIKSETDKLDGFIKSNPNLTQEQVSQVVQRSKQRTQQMLDEMEQNRQKALDAITEQESKLAGTTGDLAQQVDEVAAAKQAAPQGVVDEGAAVSPEIAANDVYYHGSTNPDLKELVPGSSTGLNEKRNLVYLTDKKETAIPYTKARGADGTLTDLGTGKVYGVNLDGKVIDGTDKSLLEQLKQVPGYSQLSGKTRNQLGYDSITADILETNPELVKFLQDNGISGVKMHLPNTHGEYQIVALDPKSVRMEGQALSNSYGGQTNEEILFPDSPEYKGRDGLSLTQKLSPDRIIREKVTRPVEDMIDRVVAAAQRSKIAPVRGVGRFFTGISREFGVDPALQAARMQLRGGSEYGKLMRENIADLSKNMDSSQLSRIWANLDPEQAARLDIKAGQLSPEELVVHDKLKALIDNTTEENLRRGLITPEQAESGYIKRAYSVYDGNTDGLTKFEQGFRQELLGQYKGRKNVSDEMVETAITDPTYLVGKKTAESQAMWAMQDYGNYLAKNNIAIDTAQKGYTQLPDSKVFGDAAGKWVPRNVAEDFTGFQYSNAMVSALSDVMNVYDRWGVRQAKKQLLTIFNPAVRLGNQVSNRAIFSTLNGVNPVQFNKVFYEVDGMMKQGHPLYREAVQQGLTGVDITQAEFYAKRIADAANGDPNMAKRALQWTQESYSNADDKARIAAYVVHRNRGYSPQEAARMVQRGFQDYKSVGFFYDMAAKTPIIGNAFVRFVADSIRIAKNAAVDHPLRTASTIALWSAFTNGMSIISGEGRGDVDEQGNDVSSSLKGDNIAQKAFSLVTGSSKGADQKAREGRFGAPTIPFTDIAMTTQTPWGEVNAARFMPWYSLNEINDGAQKFLPISQSPVRIVDGKPEVNGAGFGDPLLGQFFQMGFDKDFRNKSIRDPENTGQFREDLPADQQWKNVARFFGVNNAPLGREIDAIASAATDNPDIYGKERSLPQALLRSGGIKVETYGDEQIKNQQETEAYFAEQKQIEEELKKMSPEAQAAWKRLTGYDKLREKVPNEFSPGEDRYKKYPVFDFPEDKWKDYATHPELYELMRQKKVKQAADLGKQVQPEFDERLSEGFRRQLIANKTVAPGDDAELDQRMYSSPEWDYYQSLKKKYDAQFGDGEYKGDELVKHQTAPFPEKPDILKQYSALYKLYTEGKIAKPEWNDQLKAAKEAHNKATFDWTNKEREARGLPAIVWDMWNNPTFGYDETPSGFGFGFGNGNYNPADHVNMTTELTNYSQGIKRLNPIEAEAMPNIVALFQKLRAGSGGGRRKPTIGASSRGQG